MLIAHKFSLISIDKASFNYRGTSLAGAWSTALVVILLPSTISMALRKNWLLINVLLVLRTSNEGVYRTLTISFKKFLWFFHFFFHLDSLFRRFGWCKWCKLCMACKWEYLLHYVFIEHCPNVSNWCSFSCFSAQTNLINLKIILVTRLMFVWRQSISRVILWTLEAIRISKKSIKQRFNKYHKFSFKWLFVPVSLFHSVFIVGYQNVTKTLPPDFSINAVVKVIFFCRFYNICMMSDSS